MGQRTGDFVNGNKHLADLRYWFRTMSQEEVWKGVLAEKGGTTQLEVLVSEMMDLGSVENILRRTIRPPQDLEEAKSDMLELEGYIEAWTRRENISRSRLDNGRVPLVLSCFWHFQEPDAWPIFFEVVRDRFNLLGMSYSGYMIDQYFDFIELCREVEDEIGIDLYTLEHICEMVKRGHLAIPDVSEARDRRIIAAKALDAEGDLEGAIDEYEKALALVPDDIEVLRRCGEIWEAKGQWRLAREEYAEILRTRPEDRMAANKIRSLERLMKN